MSWGNKGKSIWEKIWSVMKDEPVDKDETAAWNMAGIKEQPAGQNVPPLRQKQAVIRRTGESDVMRILIMSDTHGSHGNLDQVLESERPYEQIIHLGDIEGAEDYIETAAGCPVEAVRGNNDYFSTLPEEKIIEAAGKRILITHGHYYYVAAGVERLIKEAQGRDVDIVMFGHTHRPLIRREGSLTVINPGSLSYPRQEGRRPSYIVMEIGPKGAAEFLLKYL